MNPADRYEEIKALREAGNGWKTIARITGLNRTTLRFHFDPDYCTRRETHNLVWTNARCAKIKAMKLAGLSNGEIGRVFSTTRNAIASAVSKMQHRGELPPAKPTPRRAKAKLEPKPPVARPSLPVTLKPHGKPPRHAYAVKSDPKGITAPRPLETAPLGLGTLLMC